MQNPKNLILGVCFCVFLFSQCGKEPEQDFTGDSGVFEDARDGNSYNWIRIGDQIWMAENLAYLPEISIKVSDTDPCYYVYGSRRISTEEARGWLSYQTYGVMYNWPAAMGMAQSSDKNPSGIRGVCPKGWHLPSNSEWKQLESLLGMPVNALDEYGDRGTDQGNKLMKDEALGFYALMGGWMNNQGDFYSLGFGTGFWTSTDDSPKEDGPWRRWLYVDLGVINNDPMSRDDAYYCRCVKD